MTAAVLEPNLSGSIDEPHSALAPISWKAPIAYGVLTVISLVGFTVFTPSDRVTQFSISTRSDFVSIPDFALPSLLTAGIGTVILALLTAYAIRQASQRRHAGLWLPALFGLVWVFTLLTWVMAGNALTVQLTGLLVSAVFLAVPLVFGSMAGLICEHVGVINVAIEGQLLVGAFMAAVAATLFSNPYAGLLGAPLAGALFGWLLAMFTVRYWVDQIIVGVVLNVLASGLTSYLYSTVLKDNSATLNSPPRLPTWSIPGLSEIPIIGPVVFQQNALVYIMVVIVVALYFLLYRSRWGLRMRACGEHPKAADTVGIKVNRTRVRNTILGGAVAGLGGAFFTVGSGLTFEKEMSAGNGFIALAAMILGRWNPKGAVAASLLFGFATGLQAMLSPTGTAIPSQFLLMTPYIVTIFAVAGLVGRVTAPAAEGIPYKG